MDEYTIPYELVDLLPINIYWKNRYGIYCGCNQLQANMMGIKSKDEVIGKTDFNFLPPEEALAIQTLDQEVISSAKPLIVEENITLGGKEYLFLSTKAPWKNKKGEILGTYGFSIDKSPQREIKHLETLQGQILNQLESTQIFASSIAHELATPLLSLELSSSWMISEMTKNEIPNLIAQKMKNMKEELTQVRGLMRSLMQCTLNRIDANDFTDCSILKIIEKVLQHYPYFTHEQKEKIQWDRNHEFHFKGHALLVEQILINLIKNAFRSIELAKKGHIEIWQSETPHFYQTHVKDTGLGIDPNNLESLFALGVTQTNGNGIGLAFCKQIMQNLGGDITGKSKLNEFAEFILHFPIPEQPSTIVNNQNYERWLR